MNLVWFRVQNLLQMKIFRNFTITIDFGISFKVNSELKNIYGVVSSDKDKARKKGITYDKRRI